MALDLSAQDQLYNFLEMSDEKIYKELQKQNNDYKKVIGKSTWISDNLIHVYIRCRMRVIEDEPRITLDIGNIEVSENYRRRGVFKNFLTYAHMINPWDATYVENVTNGILWIYLEKENWNLQIQPLVDIAIMRSYYKLK